VVGGVAACVDIGLFMLLARGMGLAYQPVGAATFVLATLVNYVLSVRFVFVSGARFGRKSEIALVYVVSAVGLGINALMLWAGVEVAHASLFLSKIAATGTVFFWNYFARRHLVFGPPRA
jgi:putative flippase GtrA